MKNKHRNIKRITHRLNEELHATMKIAQVLNWKDAICTLKAKYEIQVMNKQGYFEDDRRKHILLKKHDVMLNYYSKTFSDFLNNYTYEYQVEELEKDYSNCIWVCWWQGLDNAPQIVKNCVNSIINNAGEHPVIVITDDNYKDFIDIPDFVEEKRKKGIITKTNFSDLLRLSLLAKYGGMWLDATFLCIGDLNHYFSLPIWSIKRPDYAHASVAGGNFAGYSLACNKDYRWVFKIIRDFFLHYWEENDMMVDYLMVDYMIVLAQKCNKKVEEAFKLIEPNNKNCDELYKVLGDTFESSKWNRIKEDTILFKLTWKSEFPNLIEEKPTFFGKIIENSIID